MSKPRAILAAVPAAPLRLNASLPLMLRLEEVVSYDTVVQDPANVKEAHDMRIAVKRLRYTLEIFRVVIEDSAEYLKTLKRLQETLGGIHDADVLIERLDEDTAREDTPQEQHDALSALRACLVADRARLYQQFLETWRTAVAAGFLTRLWNAAVAASAMPDGPAAPEMNGYRLLPPRRMRRVQKAVALARLVPHAAAFAPPDRVLRLMRALEMMHDAMFGPSVEDVSDVNWWKSVKRLGRLISYDEA